jgi:hypothetical protein
VDFGLGIGCATSHQPLLSCLIALINVSQLFASTQKSRLKINHRDGIGVTISFHCTAIGTI